MKSVQYVRALAFATAALALAPGAASAAACGAGFAYSNTFTPNASYTAQWGLCGDDNDSLQVKVSAATNGWVALAFARADATSGGMMEAGIDTFQAGVGAGGVAYGIDGFANQYAAPDHDALQNVTIVSATEAGLSTTVEFFRKLNTGDTAGDFNLGDGAYWLVWSFRSSSILPDGTDFQHSGSGNSNAPIQLAAPAPVPLPAAVWLFGSALAGLCGFRRRRAA